MNSDRSCLLHDKVDAPVWARIFSTTTCSRQICTVQYVPSRTMGKESVSKITQKSEHKFQAGRTDPLEALGISQVKEQSPRKG